MAEADVNSRAPDSRSAKEVPHIGLACALVLAVLVAYGLNALFFAGPSMRAAARQETERAIAAEDRAFCAKFGMREGAADFVACIRELAIIRQRQAERDSAAGEGIL